MNGSCNWRKGANDPDDSQTAKRARERLDLLGEVDELPFGAGRPFPSFVEDDDDDGSFNEPFGQFGFGEDEEDGGLPVFSPTDSPESLYAKFARVCRSLGLDPAEVLDARRRRRAVLDSRAKDIPSSKRKKWK